MIHRRGRLKDELEALSLYGRVMSMLVFSCLLANKFFAGTFSKKAAIKQETVVKYLIDISQVLFLLGRDSYSENIMKKRSKANFNHSNKNELASSFLQYVGTSYDKRMILFSIVLTTEIWDGNTRKKQLKIL